MPLKKTEGFQLLPLCLSCFPAMKWAVSLHHMLLLWCAVLPQDQKQWSQQLWTGNSKTVNQKKPFVSSLSQVFVTGMERWLTHWSIHLFCTRSYFLKSLASGIWQFHLVYSGSSLYKFWMNFIKFHLYPHIYWCFIGMKCVDILGISTSLRHSLSFPNMAFLSITFKLYLVNKLWKFSLSRKNNV